MQLDSLQTSAPRRSVDILKVFARHCGVAMVRQVAKDY
jgi:hypothetical protein